MEEIIKIINQLREESSTNGKLKILKILKKYCIIHIITAYNMDLVKRN